MLSLICAVFLNAFIGQLSAVMQITVMIEKDNVANRPLITHLNVSFMYFRDYYGVGQEIAMNVAYLTNQTTKAFIVQQTEKTDNVISLLDNPDLINILQQVSQQVDMATVQLQLSYWNGLYLAAYDNETSSKNYVKMVPAVTTYDNLLPELFTQLNIVEGVTVIYDDFYLPDDVKWQTIFRKLPISVSFTPMANYSDPEAIQKQLEALSKKTKVLVFVAKTVHMEQFVLHAQSFIETKHFQWIVFSKDTLPFKCDSCVSADMFWVRPLDSGNNEDLRSLADFVAAQELNIDMDYKIKDYEELWISACIDAMKITVFTMISNNDTLLNMVPNNLKSQFTVMNTNRLLNMMNLTQIQYQYGQYIHHYQSYYFQDTKAAIFKIDRVAALPDAYINKYVGNWTFMNGIDVLYESLNVDVRKLNHYRVVTILQEPFIELATKPTIGVPFQGYCIDLLNLIQREMNFTYEIYLVPDGKFGTVDDNGNWNGLIGEVVIGTADIALAPLSVMAERENDIDFTVPYYDLVGTTILMKKSNVEYSLFKFMKVLEWPVWVCIVAAYFFTSFLLWIFDRFSPYSYSNNREKFKDDPDKRDFTLKECLWFCLTSLTPQGGGEAPKNVSGRLVAATWWLFGFIIIASYTANLAAFLTVSRLEQSITSLDDLSKQYKVEYAPLRGGATETYFKRMAEIEELLYNTWKAMSLNDSMSPLDRAKLAVWDYPISDKFTNMWRYIQESKLPNTATEAINRVLTSDTGFAFIGDAMEIKYAILTSCQLQQVGAEFSRKPYAIAVQSGSALKDNFSVAILKLLNERQLETLKEKWWNENPKAVKCPNIDEESNGISIQNIGGVFIVILAGILLSFVTLIFEYMYYKRKLNKTRQEPERKNSEVIDTGPVRRRTLHNGSVAHYTNSAFQF